MFLWKTTNVLLRENLDFHKITSENFVEACAIIIGANDVMENYCNCSCKANAIAIGISCRDTIIQDPEDRKLFRTLHFPTESACIFRALHFPTESARKRTRLPLHLEKEIATDASFLPSCIRRAVIICSSIVDIQSFPSLVLWSSLSWRPIFPLPCICW